LSNPYRFSHHSPERADFSHHVIVIGGMYFCRGCLLAGVGMLCSVFFWLCWAQGWLNEITAGWMFYCLLAVQVINRMQRRKWLSMFARFSLGYLLGAALQLFFLTEQNWVRVAILGHYICGRCLLPRILRHEA
jgi:hypothetical protein